MKFKCCQSLTFSRFEGKIIVGHVTCSLIMNTTYGLGLWLLMKCKHIINFKILLNFSLDLAKTAALAAHSKQTPQTIQPLLLAARSLTVLIVMACKLDLQTPGHVVNRLKKGMFFSFFYCSKIGSITKTICVNLVVTKDFIQNQITVVTVTVQIEFSCIIMHDL